MLRALGSAGSQDLAAFVATQMVSDGEVQKVIQKLTSYSISILVRGSGGQPNHDRHVVVIDDSRTQMRIISFDCRSHAFSRINLGREDELLHRRQCRFSGSDWPAAATTYTGSRSSPIGESSSKFPSAKAFATISSRRFALSRWMSSLTCQSRSASA